MPVSVQPVPILSDNYAWLLRDSGSGAVAIVDPADADGVAPAIEAAGRLDLILLTHHHPDHVAGTDTVRAKWGCPVVGAAADAHRLPKLDIAVREGDEVKFGATSAVVLDVPGHTRGHIAYFFPKGAVLLCGDTLFSVGCGRLLEGTADEMFASLKKLAALPDETLVACGHEYTESNVRFALTVEPENLALHARALEVKQLRGAGRATVPSLLAQERATNPFLRAPNVQRLAEIRAAKDRF
ncbi:MAG TPA: hydroxyacylglutathione hydrolase [Acetobacteraceae bacterium]|nr:hydroxyacylglutathione hydrolase [Acetobacteraceae bacterium]